MSIHRSYFSKNNTIIYNSLINTGQNPVVDLFFGSSNGTVSSPGFSRLIFDLDLNTLYEKYNNGTLGNNCCNVVTTTTTNSTITTTTTTSPFCVPNMKHVLMMTNTIKFDDSLINTYNSDDRLRATSFDLVLFRIPKTNDGFPQYWDEGVGYDYYNTNKTLIKDNGYINLTDPEQDKQVSDRPSNWYQGTTLEFWGTPGIYDNKNSGTTNYSGLTIIAKQHFEFGNEDINFDMTDEINGILTGQITGVTGWGIAFLPDFENITGLTSNYSVSFFSRHTQTFYEPFLLTTYDDIIQDDRNLFVEFQNNKLYLYVNIGGKMQNLDTAPTVSIFDSNGDPLTGMTDLPSCQRTLGVYEVSLPEFVGYFTPCTFTDKWSNVYYNGIKLPGIENEFILQPFNKKFKIGSLSVDPQIYGFDFYGIKQDEKILNTDIRKVGVVIKKAYTTNTLLPYVDASYRIYVREGTTEVQVQDWTTINRTPNEYYFIFDTRDKIPNEYYIDIKVESSGQIDTYKKQIKFQIVNKK
jgi:hypothetical protein